MSFSPDEFAARAEECVRLAKLTPDIMIQTELLELRQTYLAVRRRLLTHRLVSGNAGHKNRAQKSLKKH